MVRCHRFCLLKLCLLKLFVLKLCLLGISCAEQTQKTDSRSRSATNPGLKGSFNQNAATGTVTDTNPVQSTESNNPADNADVDPNTDSGSTDGPDEDPGSNSSNTTSEQIGQKPVSSPGAGDGISEENENNSGAAMDNNSSSQNSTNNSGDGLLPVVAEFLPGPVSEPGILPLTVNPKIAATKQIPLEGNQKLLIAEDAVFLETEPGKTIGFAHSFGQLELAGTEDNRIFLVRPRQTDREKFEYFELTQAGLQQKLIDLAENTNALHIRRAGGSWVHVPPLYSPLPENPTDPIIGNGGQPILLQVYEGSEWKERPIASVSEDNQPVDLSKDPILLMRRIPGIILGSGERLPNPDPSMAYILITYDLGQTWKYKTLPFKAAGSALLHTDGYLGFRTQEGLAVSNNGQDFTQKPYPVFDPAPELGQPITRYFTDKMIVVHTQETEANPHIIAADLTENWGVFSEFADCADVEWNRLQSGFVYQPTGQPRSLNLATKSCEKVPELQNPVVFDDSRRQVNGQEFRWYAATPDSQFVLQQRASGSQNWIDRPDVTFQKSASCTGNPGLVHFFSQTGTFEISHTCSINNSPRYYRFVSQDMGVSWQKQQSDLRDYSTLQDGTRFKIAPAIGNVPLRALVSQDQGATGKPSCNWRERVAAPYADVTWELEIFYSGWETDPTNALSKSSNLEPLRPIHQTLKIRF